jgi:D-amino peptidase
MRTVNRSAVKALILTQLMTLIACGRVVAQDGQKIALIYDMEGLITVQTSRDCSFGSDTYANSRQSLTDEVNAAIRGLLKAGASEVVLTDGHGSGNPEPDYDLSQLPDGARFEIRDNPYDAYIDVFDRTTDAVVAIGMHAGAGSEGVVSHTYYGHTRWVMNDDPLNESMIVAASAARFGAPLILVTGDNVLRDQVASFNPATRYVVTKRALSRTRAEARPREEVLLEIERMAEEALGDLGSIPVWSPEPRNGVLENHFSYTRPEHASLAINYPGAVTVNDRTIGLRSDSFIDAYLAFRALANFTALAPMRTMFDALREVEGGMDVYRRIREQLSHLPAPGFEPAGTEIDVSASAKGRHGYR